MINMGYVQSHGVSNMEKKHGGLGLVLILSKEKSGSYLKSPHFKEQQPTQNPAKLRSAE